MGSTTTIEAVIRDGRIYLTDPGKLPKSGKALLIVLDEESAKIDPEKIRPLLGWLKSDVDAVQWQRRIRDEWERHL